MNYDLKLIKDKYGENMMHLCRSLFPSLLEENGLLFGLLRKNFEYSKSLYSDIIKSDKVAEFKKYILSFTNQNKETIVKNKTVKELFDEVGYILYECKTEKDIQKFKKYYTSKEMICTFLGGRLNTNYVFFAVKKNVDAIKRKNFINPQREDDYGTSVISIQFDRGVSNYMSIKNRYNHTVKNPDYTFYNNLELINPGLTEAFIRDYGFHLFTKNKEFEIPGYIKFNNKFYKVNYNLSGIYYCPNNIVIDSFNNHITKYDKEKYLVFDHFVLDLVNKCFIGDNPSIFNPISRIEIFRNRFTKGKVVRINEEVLIILDRDSRMIGYFNPNITIIDSNFLHYNEYLKTLSLPNVEAIDDAFLLNNKVLENLYLDNIEVIYNDFLRNCKSIKTLYMPKIKKVGNYFLPYANMYNDTLYLPYLEIVGDAFLSCANIKEIDFPNLKITGKAFLQESCVDKISLPNIEQMGRNSLLNSKCVKNENAKILKL